MGTPLMDRIRGRRPEAATVAPTGMGVSGMADGTGPRPPARVPEWIRRMDKGELPAKDTTGTVSL